MSAPRNPRLLLSLAGGLLAATVLAPLATTSSATAGSEAADPGAAAGLKPPSVWTSSEDSLTQRRDGRARMVAPREYAGYHLDMPTLDTWLANAPLERSDGAPLRIQVPAPDGTLKAFDVRESSVMESGLAAQYPQINTWAGRAVEGEASIRLDVTPLGFHASVRGDGLSWYVDPAYKGANQGPDALYVSYLGAALPERDQKLVEPEEMLKEDGAGGLGDALPRVGEEPGALVQARTYRLALMTDPAYARYFTSSTDPVEVNEVVTAAKVTLVNRINQIYADDFSARLVLVNATDRTNLNTDALMSGANGPCGASPCFTPQQASGDCSAVFGPLIDVAGQLVGAENYDIGHMALGKYGGGVANQGVVGYTSKARGCTGISPPVGDAFAIDYVSHELGHQFGASHTFNGNHGGCTGGNRNAANSVEPGSGSSVMSYAGICGWDNLQPHSDPYFSQRSQTQIAEVIRRTPAATGEVVNVGMSGFDAGDSFTLNFGTGASSAITFDQSYTAADIKAAVEAAEPSAATVTVRGFRGDPDFTNGFQLVWSGREDMPTPTLQVASGTFTSVVGTSVNGGPSTNGGVNVITTGNRTPIVTAPEPKTIPKQTPFVLTGVVNDPDGDSVINMWEQNDSGQAIPGGTNLLVNDKPGGPLFRIFGTYADVTGEATRQYNSPGENLATSSPTRYFPDLAQVLAGNTNAVTGRCSVEDTPAPTPEFRDCFSEFLPTSARVLNFRLTARDQGGPDGGYDGGVGFDDVAITVSDLGPFLVESQGASTSVTGNDLATIQWTAGMESLAENVKISMSVDGGLTYPHVLAASTPNDGSQEVRWPNLNTTEGRIKIEAVDNYFFDVNDAPITITEALDIEAPQTSVASGPANNAIVTSDDVSFRFASSEAGSTFVCTVRGQVRDCPQGEITLDKPAAGTYEVTAVATDEAGNVDASPVTRVVHVPVNDRALTKVKGAWANLKNPASYRDTFRRVSTTGATLKRDVSRVTSVGVVVTKGPGYGPIKVLFNGKAIGTINTSRATLRADVVINVASFANPRTGTVKLVTTSGKQVRVEGLALRTELAP